MGLSTRSVKVLIISLSGLMLVTALFFSGCFSTVGCPELSHPKNIKAVLGSLKGYGGCGICGNTWDYTKEHIIYYASPERGETLIDTGAFPTCEVCFRTAPIEKIDKAIDNLVAVWQCQLKGKDDFSKDAEAMKRNVRWQREAYQSDKAVFIFDGESMTFKPKEAEGHEKTNS